jgi:tetratricopeptide (TPR) repeat protein
VGAADSGLWQRLSPILDCALDLPASERAEFVTNLRNEDPVVAAELEALLAAHDAATVEQFLERSPPPLPDSRIAAGQTLGAYTLVTEIGHGGMGSVWLAERVDGRFQRKVAVKFLSVGIAGHGGEERFRREGSLLARLAHPHIAQLIDAGVTTGGQPYLVIEHVDGEPLDRHCDGHNLGIEARLALFFDVLAAVADAHAQLIVHRDLKPSNVFVTREGKVKLLDFGIAKLLDDGAPEVAETRLTRVGGWALTPEYAAPEQLTGAPISTATDVYALGVMLYELLCGRHPLGAPLLAPVDIVKAVAETEPPHMTEAVSVRDGSGVASAIARSRGTTPERLKLLLRGDLDTIVRKALKKNPAERYASVTALAEDLRRYLRHEPIGARPDSMAYRAGKFVRRNRTGVALAAMAILAAIAGVIGTLYQAGTARAERDYALRQLARAETLNDLNRFLLSDAAPLGRPLAVNELLERAERITRRQTAGSAETHADQLVSIGDQYVSMDESDRARDVLEAAYAMAHSTGDRVMRARSACSLAAPLAKGGQLERSTALVQEGLTTLPDDARFTLDRIYCLLKASYVAREAGATSTAIARIEEARRLLEHSPYRSAIQDFNIQMDLAESYSQAGQHGRAIPAFESAAKVLAALGRDQTQVAGTLYNNWALSLDIAGRPRDAEAIYRRAIDVSRSDETNDAVSPMLLLNYGRSLRALGRLDEAARHAEEGYERGKAKGLEVVVNQALLVRAQTYREQGDLVRSAAMLAEVEPRLQQALPPGHSAFGSLMFEKALTAMAAGDEAAALTLIDRAYEIADGARRGGGSADYAPRVLVRRSEFSHAAGRYAEAAADARLALDQLDDIIPRDLLTTFRGDAYLALGHALMGQRRVVEGEAALREALRQLESALGPDHARVRGVRLILDPTA